MKILTKNEPNIQCFVRDVESVRQIHCKRGYHKDL